MSYAQQQTGTNQVRVALRHRGLLIAKPARPDPASGERLFRKARPLLGTLRLRRLRITRRLRRQVLNRAIPPLIIGNRLFTARPGVTAPRK